MSRDARVQANKDRIAADYILFTEAFKGATTNAARKAVVYAHFAGAGMAVAKGELDRATLQAIMYGYAED